MPPVPAVRAPTRVRRDLMWVLAAGLLLGALIAFLDGIDRRRAQRQMDALALAVCGVVLPPAVSRTSDRLFVQERAPKAREHTDLVAHLAAAMPLSSSMEVFLEADATLWSINRWSGRAPASARWPQAIGRWEQVAWAEGCRSARDGTRLIVARTVATPGGRFLVLVVTQHRDRG